MFYVMLRFFFICTYKSKTYKIGQMHKGILGSEGMTHILSSTPLTVMYRARCVSEINIVSLPGILIMVEKITQGSQPSLVLNEVPLAMRTTMC